MSLVCSYNIQLYQFKAGQIRQFDNKFTIDVIKLENYRFKVEFNDKSENETHLTADILNILNLQYQEKDNRVFFDIEYHGKLLNFSFVFENREKLHNFLREFVESLLMAKYQTDVSGWEEDINNIISSMMIDDSQDDLPVRRLHYKVQGKTDNGTNTKILILTKSSFVVTKVYTKHSIVGLFNINTHIKFGGSTKLDIFIEDACALNENSVVFLANSALYLFDTEKGDISKKIIDNIKITSLVGVDENGLIIGVSSMNSYAINPETGEVTSSEYRTNNHFVCGELCDGGIAIGASDGTVRLYPSAGKSRATTSFVAAPDAISSISALNGGALLAIAAGRAVVLAGTKHPATGRLGFRAALGRERPPAMRLSLFPEDLEAAGAPFSKVRSLEGRIAASAGKVVAVWDAKLAMEGSRSYTAHIFEEDVADIAFIGGKLIVATANSVSIVQ